MCSLHPICARERSKALITTLPSHHLLRAVNRSPLFTPTLESARHRPRRKISPIYFSLLLSRHHPIPRGVSWTMARPSHLVFFSHFLTLFYPKPHRFSSAATTRRPCDPSPFSQTHSEIHLGITFHLPHQPSPSFRFHHTPTHARRSPTTSVINTK